MSFDVTRLVWDMELPAPEKLVLLKVAFHCDQDGRNAYPAVATIAKSTGLSERTVQRSIAAMVETGVLEETAPATSRRPKTYRIDVSRGVTQSPLGVPESHPTGDRESPQGRQAVTPGVSHSRNRGVRVSPEQVLELIPKQTLEPVREEVAPSPKRRIKKADIEEWTIREPTLRIPDFVQDYIDWQAGLPKPHRDQVRGFENQLKEAWRRNKFLKEPIQNGRSDRGNATYPANGTGASGKFAAFHH